MLELMNLSSTDYDRASIATDRIILVPPPERPIQVLGGSKDTAGGVRLWPNCRGRLRKAGGGRLADA